MFQYILPPAFCAHSTIGVGVACASTLTGGASDEPPNTMTSTEASTIAAMTTATALRCVLSDAKDGRLIGCTSQSPCGRRVPRPLA
jgi:hypothetical protein